jgi:hypothetical protein
MSNGEGRGGDWEAFSLEPCPMRPRCPQSGPKVSRRRNGGRRSKKWSFGPEARRCMLIYGKHSFAMLQSTVLLLNYRSAEQSPPPTYRRDRVRRERPVRDGDVDHKDPLTRRWPGGCAPVLHTPLRRGGSKPAHAPLLPAVVCAIALVGAASIPAGTAPMRDQPPSCMRDEQGPARSIRYRATRCSSTSSIDMRSVGTSTADSCVNIAQLCPQDQRAPICANSSHPPRVLGNGAV